MTDNVVLLKKYRDCPHCGAAMLPLPPKGKVMCSWYGCPGPPPAPPTYREKQHHRYTLAMASGNQDSAADALWRAASEANLLSPAEHSHTDLTAAMGWAS